MNFVPIPVSMLEVGKPLPVNIVSQSGQLLLRKGQPIVSQAHRDKLESFNASASPADAHAWQKAYGRMVHEMLRAGVPIGEIAKLPMPSEIRDSDYVEVQRFSGGWLDLQEVLRGLLYQGGLTLNPLERMLGIQDKAAALVGADTDDSLFVLFQALTDDGLGYCATHALLCAVVCELTASKLGLDPLLRQSLMAAALTMNISMAREQDSMTRQATPLSPEQRALVDGHAQASAEVLAGLGVDNQDWLDIVRLHHQPDSAQGLAPNLGARRILHLADVFVARVVARRTRGALSPLSAVKTMVMGAQGEVVGLGSAMAQAVGFYPPGTYVQLHGGELAVSVRRGERANTPWVVPIVDKDAMPIGIYVCRDTSDPRYGIAAAVNFESARVAVSLDKVRKARQRMPAV